MLFNVFHVLMTVVDLVVLRRLLRDRGAKSLVTTIALTLFVLASLSLLLPQVLTGHDGQPSLFGTVGCAAWGLFIHLPILGLAAAHLHRTELPRASRTLAITSVAIAAVGVQAFLIEPTWIEVSHHSIRSAKLERPLRLVVVADLQTERAGAYERRALELALAAEPDALVFTGDYVQAGGTDYERECARLRDLLLELGLGEDGPEIIAVEGNCERPGWGRIFDGTGAATFLERGTTPALGITFSGLPLHESFARRPFVEAAEGFHVIVGHAPDFAREAAVGDLFLAGHTHGGQVRLPFLGPPITLSGVPRAWAAGRTDLPEGRTLIVSRGIGMERGQAPRLRFLCRPEIVVIDLLPE